MRDPDLMRLIDAMDRLVTAGDLPLAEASDVAALRLQCLEQRLGDIAEASPYLQYLRRTATVARRSDRLAASA